MKRFLTVCSVVFSGVACAGDLPALSLWVTTPIGATNGSQCGVPGVLPTSAPTLTEFDFSAWKTEEQHGVLDNKRFTPKSEYELVDHCFVLVVKGKELARGLILSSHSARWSDLPTIYLQRKKTGLEAGFYQAGHGAGSSPRLSHPELLQVLAQLPAASE